MRAFTAFGANGKFYQFKRSPFLVTNGVACFQRAMDKFAADSGLRNVFVYLDDFTVTGATKEEHDENLQKLIDAAKVGLKFKKGSVNFVIRI